MPSIFSIVFFIFQSLSSNFPTDTAMKPCALYGIFSFLVFKQTIGGRGKHFLYQFRCSQLSDADVYLLNISGVGNAGWKLFHR